MTHLRLLSCFVYLGSIKSRKIESSVARIVHGEGFKTVAATCYETVTAMTNLAIVNCQIHGRNALNLKVYYIFSMAISCCIIGHFCFRFPNLGYSPRYWRNNIKWWWLREWWSCIVTKLLCAIEVNLVAIQTRCFKFRMPIVIFMVTTPKKLS